MEKDKKIYQKAKKEAPEVVYDYGQAVLIHNLSESLRTPKEVFTEAEAAEYLRVKLQTLKNYAKKKKITWSLVGKEKVYTKKELDSFLDRKSRLYRHFN
ncbi:MAG: helix-turn-helix domain-containing protein [Bacteriovoracaceae bacterium]|nr:helix-turn-helix domain-containing protein [Bacteriovoracaceae bacterium]